MSAEVIGKTMPAVITLDDLTAMNAADAHGRRYETSAEGVLTIAPPPTIGHAVIASRLMAWLLTAGWPAEQILQVPGLRIPGPAGEGGRIPDLTVWSRPQPPAGVWQSAADLLLVIEIVSPASEGTDRVTKVTEYASAGIPQYWTVGRDAANTVTLYRLNSGGDYDTAAQMPLAWLLKTSPEEYLGSAG